MLKVAPQPNDGQSQEFGQEQRKDPYLNRLIQFLETGNLPGDASQLPKIAAQVLHFSIVDRILYFVSEKQSRNKLLFPSGFDKSCCRRLTVEF